MTHIIIGNNELLQKTHTLNIINRYNQSDIKDYTLLSSNPYIHILSTDENSIKIEDVRDFIQKIKYKPFESKYQFGIIEIADRLTTESQNAILKTLEEQNDNTNIIIQVYNSKSILDTILSRGVKTYIQDIKKIQETYTLKLSSTDLVEKFKQVEVLAKLPKQDILSELSSMSSTLSTILGNSKGRKTNELINLISQIERAHKLIDSNGNKKLVLENLVIQTSNIK